MTWREYAFSVHMTIYRSYTACACFRRNSCNKTNVVSLIELEFTIPPIAKLILEHANQIYIEKLSKLKKSLGSCANSEPNSTLKPRL